jgi:hypothetical protein
MNHLRIRDTEVCKYDVVGEIKRLKAGCQWLTPVMLATQEGENRRISVQSQPLGK